MSEIYTLEIPQLKMDEGFRAEPYTDSLGFDTQGYGTKLPLTDYEEGKVKNLKKWTEAEAEFLLKYRLGITSKALFNNKKKIFLTLSQNRRRVLYNMCYQLGILGLMRFKKMWEALENKDYPKAADEMKDSRWYNQTPNRAKRLINRMIDG